MQDVADLKHDSVECLYFVLKKVTRATIALLLPELIIFLIVS